MTCFPIELFWLITKNRHINWKRKFTWITQTFCMFGGNFIHCSYGSGPEPIYPADTQCWQPWYLVDPQRSGTKGRNSLDRPLTEENGRQGNPEIGKQRKTSWPWRGVGMNVPYEPPGVGVWWQMPPIGCSESLNWSIYGGRNSPVFLCVDNLLNKSPSNLHIPLEVILVLSHVYVS